MNNYTITFATLNCLDYTKKCVESLINSGTMLEQIVVVDNASQDGTQEYLMQLGIGSAILIRQNLSC
jgi:glycosyltransferase involved in cell wall biosynthesis